MKNKRLIFCVAVAVLFAGGLVWLVLLTAAREPVYRGRPLSAWLDDSFRGSNRDEASKALDEAGDKAIPALLRMMRAYDSPLKIKLLALVDKQHFIKIPHRGATMQNIYAEMGFQFLGRERSAPAVPELLKIYNQKLSLESQGGAWHILGFIGPAAKAAVPSLLRETQNTNDNLRCSAIQALGSIHENPDSVVPVLIQGLQDSYNMVRYWSAAGLGEFAPEAKPAVPALIQLIRTEKTMPKQMFASGMEENESRAFRSLQKIDLPAATKLMEEFRRTDPTGAVTKTLENLESQLEHVW